MYPLLVTTSPTVLSDLGPRTTAQEEMAEERNRQPVQSGAMRRLHVLRASFRANIRSSRQFSSRRRRDLRFQIIPYDGWKISNGIAILVTLIVFTALIFDPYLTLWHAGLSPVLVDLFEILTDLGKSDWILISTGVYVLVSLAFDASTLGSRFRARRAIRTAAAGYVFVAVALSGLISVTVKYVLGRARPRHFDDVGSWSFDFLSTEASWSSFPSGHATTAMALGVALGLLFPRLRTAFFCAGFWIAFSRLATRDHYPSDVVAGSILGAITAWLLARALAQRRLVFGFDSLGNLIRRSGVSGRLF